MRRPVIAEAEAVLRLEASVSGLADRVPLVSARKLLTPGQRNSLLGLGAAVVLGLVLAPVDTVIALVAVITAVYVVGILYRVTLFRRAAGSDAVERVSDEEARAVPDDDLPVYTVLVPAYREPSVINLLIDNIGRLEYPVEKLDVKMLIEADDEETLEAIRSGTSQVQFGEQFELVLIPPADPRTKPKALNYGLSLARGELVCIYDAEDIPDPLQLRRAAVAMGRLGPEVACIQAKLSYHNVNQNLITRWFTVEYAMWFSFFLPGLAAVHAPIPLGGTSNHFRRNALQAMGAWDPFNVTEDADLGIRMFREGYTTRVLESTTLEEANSDFVNWMKQRSRWYKGYFQTFLIHLRSPREFYREMGGKGFFHFCIFVGGTPVLAMLNPVFWLMTVLWFVGHPAFILRIFPAPVYYLGLVCWAFGNFLLAYLTVASCRIIGRGELLWAALLVPLYWVMMSMAATKAFVQLVGAPTFWEKTVHGLHLDHAASEAEHPVAEPVGVGSVELP